MGPEWDESSRSSWVPAPSERVNEKCFQNDVSEMSPLLGEMTPQRKYQDSMLVIPSRVWDHPCGLVVFVVFDGFLSDWDWASHTHICLYIYILFFFSSKSVPSLSCDCPEQAFLLLLFIAEGTEPLLASPHKAVAFLPWALVIAWGLTPQRVGTKCAGTIRQC